MKRELFELCMYKEPWSVRGLRLRVQWLVEKGASEDFWLVIACRRLADKKEKEVLKQ